MGMCPVIFVCSHSPRCWLGDLYFVSFEVYWGGGLFRVWYTIMNDRKLTNYSG